MKSSAWCTNHHDFAEISTPLMGTLLVMKAWGEKSRSSVAQAYREIRRIEKLMSVFSPSSDVSRINRNAGVRAVKVSSETMDVLGCAVSVSEMSGGAFDVTAGPLSVLWKRVLKDHRLPERSDIDRAMEVTGFRALELDSKARRAYLSTHGASIDLGGIAKGYAADRAVSIFRRSGIKSALIDIGGNVAVVGAKQDGTPWRVGIQGPCCERGGFIGAVDIIDGAVVTSGDYEQCFDLNGERYHHIIDPRTGVPSKSGVRSATVVAKTGVMADALATATLVLGLDEGAGLVSRCDSFAVLVDDSGQVYVTPEIAESCVFEPGVVVLPSPTQRPRNWC